MFLADGDFTILFTLICFGTPIYRPPGALVSIWGTIGGGPLLFIVPGILIGAGTAGAGTGVGAGAGIAPGISAVPGGDFMMDTMQAFGQDITITNSTGTIPSLTDTETV